MEEDELQLILKKWKMETLYNKLKDAGIGCEELTCINEHDLDKLFPDINSMGIKIKFRANLKTLKNNAFINNVDSPSTKVRKWMENCSDDKSIDTDIGSILNQTPTGQEAIEYYNMNKTLTPHHQQSVANCLVDHRIANGQKLSVDHMQSLANSVCSHFSGENIDTYFSRRNKKPVGKIYDRYFNMRKKRKLNCSSPCSTTSVSSFSINGDIEVDEDLALPLKAWLRYNDTPLEEVMEKWKKTFIYRQKCIKNTDFAKILPEWPLYKNALLGAQMIDSDFSMLYPTAKTTLFEDWDKFSPLLAKYYASTIKDKLSKEMLKTSEYKLINSDSKCCILALLLNAIITPTARYKINEKIKKVTIKEAMDCFILHIQHVGILEEEILELRKRFESQNGTLQPTIVVF